MLFTITQKSYTGPLDKLLELIEERKLEITEISLAEVTADFLGYVKKLGEAKQGKETTGILADFLVIAARLLLIKSKVLLPDFALTTDEEAAIVDLETRLKIYRAFSARGGQAARGLDRSSGLIKEKNASDHFRALWRGKNQSFAREYLKGVRAGSVFLPGGNASALNIAAAAEHLAALLRDFLPQMQEVNIAIATLEEKIEELLARFKTAAEHSFGALKKGRSKTEAILLFLAILHLFKEKTIAAEQSGQFGDILIKKQEVNNE